MESRTKGIGRQSLIIAAAAFMLLVAAIGASLRRHRAAPQGTSR